MSSRTARPRERHGRAVTVVQSPSVLVHDCGIALQWCKRTRTWPTFTGSEKMTILR
jgi:hypothetical protein